jgi:sporulation protein YlmC with PRC-barrel domain
MRLSYEDQVRGRTVIDATGSAIGQVDLLYLDGDGIADGLKVSALRVKLNADAAERAGIPRTTFHPAQLDVPAFAVVAIGDAVLLNVTLTALAHPTTEAAGPPAP